MEVKMQKPEKEAWEAEKPGKSILDTYIVILKWDENDADYTRHTSFVPAPVFMRWLSKLQEIKAHEYTSHNLKVLGLHTFDEDGDIYDKTDLGYRFEYDIGMPDCHHGDFHSVEVDCVTYVGNHGETYNVDLEAKYNPEDLSDKQKEVVEMSDEEVEAKMKDILSKSRFISEKSNDKWEITLFDNQCVKFRDIDDPDRYRFQSYRDALMDLNHPFMDCLYPEGWFEVRRSQKEIDKENYEAAKAHKSDR